MYCANNKNVNNILKNKDKGVMLTSGYSGNVVIESKVQKWKNCCPKDVDVPFSHVLHNGDHLP